MPDIKTRAVAEKLVKTLDKSAIAAQRMKNVYVQAKEKTERLAPSGEDSPEGYAVDRASDAESAAVYEGIHQLDRQGRKGIDATKENLAKLKARFQRKRLIDPLKKKVRKEAAHPPVDVDGNIRRGSGIQRAANPIRRPAGALKEAAPALRGEQGEVKAVKQRARITGQAVAKTTGRAVKSAQNSAKTAEAMGRTAANTAYQTAKASQRMAQTVAATTKKVAETSISVVRAIITGTRALIAAIAAMGWVAVILLVVICLIGLIVSSPFGIFFSGEDSGTGQTMPMVVREINQDYGAQLAELLAEENHSMWSTVLYGIGAGDGEIVTVALSQIGDVGGQPYWSWYGFGSRVDWCAIFVSWCANECGYLDTGVIPKFAGCITGSQWFKDRGLWQDRNYEPRPGDLIFFDWDAPGGFSGPQDGLCDHVGIVEKVENGIVYTIEGNSGDMCREAHYPVGHYEIYGYGTPAI